MNKSVGLRFFLHESVADEWRRHQTALLGWFCSRCGQVCSTAAAGLELLYSHLLQEHAMLASEADNAVDEAVTEERVEPTPRGLPRCH